MLHALDIDEILAIADPAEIVRLMPGEFLFREGEDANCLFVVKS